jgi:hypothetical protein
MCLRRFLYFPVLPLDPGADSSFAPHIVPALCECAARMGLIHISLILVSSQCGGWALFPFKFHRNFISRLLSVSLEIFHSKHVSLLHFPFGVCGHQMAEVRLTYQRLWVLVFFFFSKEAGGYGNIREAREGNEIKMKSIERRKAHFWLLHRQTNELQWLLSSTLAGRHRTSTGRAPIRASDLRHIGNSLLLVSAIRDN